MDENNNKSNKLYSCIILVFALSFMLCIFAPIDAFYSNIEEYWFSLTQLISVCAIVFAIAFLILSIMSFLIWKTEIIDYLITFLIGLFIFLYVQGNYLPRNYGVLDGRSIDWNTYNNYAVYSIALIAVCFGICILLIVKFRNYLSLIAKAVAIFALLIQTVTIITEVIQKGHVKTGFC